MMLKTTTIRAESCDEVILTCESVINNANTLISEQDNQIKLLQDLQTTQQEEVIRLRRDNDVWYKQQPWILPTLGFLLGAATIVVIQK